MTRAAPSYTVCGAFKDGIERISCMKPALAAIALTAILRGHPYLAEAGALSVTRLTFSNTSRPLYNVSSANQGVPQVTLNASNYPAERAVRPFVDDRDESGRETVVSRKAVSQNIPIRHKPFFGGNIMQALPTGAGSKDVNTPTPSV